MWHSTGTLISFGAAEGILTQPDVQFKYERQKETPELKTKRLERSDIDTLLVEALQSKGADKEAILTALASKLGKK